MVQVNGIARLLTQRFSRDFAGKVKYSTLCPSRMDSPSEARRAIPTSRGLSGRGSKGREAIISPFVRHHNALRRRRQDFAGIGDRDDETTHVVDELINIWRHFGTL